MTPEQADRLALSMLHAWPDDPQPPADLAPYRRHLSHASYVTAVKALEVLKRRPLWPTVDELQTAIAHKVSPADPRPNHFPRVVPPVSPRSPLSREEHVAWAARVRAELAQRPGPTSTAEEDPETAPSSTDCG